MRKTAAVWTGCALLVIVALSIAQGHPSGVVFVPFVLVIWLIGQLWLELMTKEEFISIRLGGLTISPPIKAPPALIVVVQSVLLSITMGFVGLALAMALENPVNYAKYIFISLLIILVHSLLVIALLARKASSRILAAFTSCIWTLVFIYMGYQETGTGFVYVNLFFAIVSGISGIWMFVSSSSVTYFAGKGSS